MSVSAAFRARAARPLARAFTSRAVDGFVGALGNTPLVSHRPAHVSVGEDKVLNALCFFQLRLEKLSKATGCNILAKSELQNPGGSVKDRAALGVVTDAEKRGL